MDTEKAKMLAGELYDAGDPELAAERRACRRLLERFNAAHPDDDEGRRTVLEELLAALGPSSVIEPPFRCDYGYNIRIGARCQLNFGVTMLDCGAVTIGDGVLIGPGVQLLGAEHPVEPDLRRAGYERGAPVVIEDGVWLGAGAIVNPGVTVGADSVVGAGSVVTGDVPALSVAAGNPCRVLRHL